MTSLPFTNYRLDWQQFCEAQPADLAAELEALLTATQGSDDAADQCLAQVVGRAATDGAMARLVLQRVMPGLLNVAKRRSHIEPGGFCEILHDLVANAWIAVRVYPLDRRPRKIAANLVRDIEYATFVQDRRLRRVTIAEMPTQLAEQPAARSTNAGEEVIATLAAARRAGAGAEGIRLIGELTVAGRSVQELAASYGVSTRTILTRRLAAERDLALHAA
jgi:hypothetical protein